MNASGEISNIFTIFIICFCREIIVEDAYEG